jgi:hypothetical protein
VGVIGEAGARRARVGAEVIETGASDTFTSPSGSTPFVVENTSPRPLRLQPP